MTRNSGNGARILSRLVRLGTFLLIILALNWTPAFVPLVRATSEDKRNDTKEKLFRSAKKSMRAGKYADALKIYSEAMVADRHDLQAIVGASFANLKMLDYLHSFEQAMEALKLDPDNARAHALAGVALLRSGFVRAAIGELQRSFNLDPKEALAFGGATTTKAGPKSHANDPSTRTLWIRMNRIIWLPTRGLRRGWRTSRKPPMPTKPFSQSLRSPTASAAIESKD